MRGGRREGSGRKPTGKQACPVSLTKDIQDSIHRIYSKFSAEETKISKKLKYILKEMEDKI